MAAGVRLTNAQAEDEMRAAGFEPIGSYQGVDRKWLVKCMTCKEELERTLSNVRAGKGCKHCKGLVVDAAAARAEMLAAGFEPLGEYPGPNASSSVTTWPPVIKVSLGMTSAPISDAC
ncbi:hypothetical protein KDK95_06670 [Actinospica sp. MGRD01-02]|uniref:Uncharacterized protein n=1 Tax=Actinospica acidithermotolerans TaxID=2828514 RepID=A0A941E8Y0_9ACTN|nr:hypothetical protein [Actinospica acidithermotolerans]MBR7825982.1 hypothetical protein [Actinospica acidithermotolerans]